MKKLITIAIVVTLLMMTVSSALVVSAQEPTEGLAVEPTEEPMEEPTAEPTEEPIPEPTEEPTAEPTEEPIPEPTEEPTAEPTEEPIPEPTEEPTAEPTEVPVPEPTEEPTAEPTEEAMPEPTEEPTAEPTEEATAEPTDTPTPVAAEEVDAEAFPGTWTSQYIGIQNLGTSNASATLNLYQGSAVPAASIARTIYQGGGVTILPSAYADGQYSGIVSSDQPVAAAVINVNTTATVGDAYMGINSPANRLVLPGIMRGHSDWKTKFHIQNATSTAQTVTVRAYKQGAGTPSASPTYNIPGNSTVTVDFMSAAFNAFGSGLGAFGYAIVEGAGDLAIVTEIYSENTASLIALYYNGFREADAAQDLIVPGCFSGHSAWYSGIQVINTSNQATNVTMTYTLAPAYGGASYSNTVAVGAYGSANFALAYLGLPIGYGSATVHSSNANAKLLALVTSYSYYYTTVVGFEFPAYNSALATTRVAVPVAFNTGGYTDWNTGVAVYSVGAGGNIRTTWVRANVDPSAAGNSFQYTLAGTANSVTSFDAATLAGLPTNFVGTVFVESLGGQPIMAVVNQTRYSQNWAGQFAGHNY